MLFVIGQAPTSKELKFYWEHLLLPLQKAAEALLQPSTTSPLATPKSQSVPPICTFPAQEEPTGLLWATLHWGHREG